MKQEKSLSDLALAAFLSSRGYEILGIKGNGKKSLFVFEDTPQLEQDVLKYFNRQGMVDALTYGEVLRNLKALVLNRS
ncbi:MAG: DUF5659 domain-containing protein [Thermodesulfobacteriota bacterium]